MSCLKATRTHFAYLCIMRMQTYNIFLGKCAGQDPAEVLMNQDFYDDVIENADSLELTLMAIVSRPLAVAPLQVTLAQLSSQFSLGHSATALLRALHCACRSMHTRQLAIPQHMVSCLRGAALRPGCNTEL